MNTTKIALSAAAALAACSFGAARAQDFTPKTARMTMLDVRLSDVAPQGSDPVYTTAGARTGLSAKAHSDVMPTLGVTHFFTDNIALEVIAGTTEHKIRARGPATNVVVKKTWVLPPVVAVQYHFAPQSRISPYVGAGVNYMLFYNDSDQNGFHFKLHNALGTALQAGVDVAATGRWQVNLDAKKIFVSTRATDRVAGLTTRAHLDPWVLSGGLGYRF